MQVVELTNSRRLSRLAAPFMQGEEALSEFEPDALAAHSGVEVGDVGLGRANLVSDLALRQPGLHEVCDDFFPHGRYDSNCCCRLQQRALVQHLLSGGYVAAMEIDEIRRRRLREWIDTDPVSMGDVEAWCGYYSQFVQKDESPLSPTYIRQLVPKRGNPNRNIGEKVARRLERIGQKPSGWLDASPEATTPRDILNQEPSHAQVKGIKHPVHPSARRSSPEAAPDESRLAPRSMGADHSAALLVQIGFLRDSAAAIARALNINPEDLVSAGADARARVEAAVLGVPVVQDDEIDGVSVSKPTADHRRPRQTQNVTTSTYSAEVEPRTDDERAAEVLPHKERRS